jgi:flavin reductase (DIM6/NTAB) family NADH-FMN oxidoreductase RutF
VKKKPLTLANVYKLLEPGPVVMVSSCYKQHSNMMTLSWQTMLDFEPPLIGCVISNRNDSFELIRRSKQCVINIPDVTLLKQIVAVGNSHGRKINKFAKFELTPVPAETVQAPMIDECFANLECKVIDTRLVEKYNLFILRVNKAWIAKTKKPYKTEHHAGNGIFVVDGKIIKTASRMK